MGRRAKPRTRRVASESPLEAFGGLLCPSCDNPLRVLKSRNLKTRLETRVVAYCSLCRARYRLIYTA